MNIQLDQTFRLRPGKKFWSVKVESCPGKPWMSHLWKCSKPNWTGLWVPWSSARCLCPWQGDWNKKIFNVTSNPIILWFYNFTILWLFCKHFFGNENILKKFSSTSLYKFHVLSNHDDPFQYKPFCDCICSLESRTQLPVIFWPYGSMFSDIFFSFISLLNYVLISFCNYPSNAYMFQQKMFWSLSFTSD